MRLDLEISPEIDALLAMFKNSPDKTRKAINRALGKLARWTERQVLREIAARVQVTQKVLKDIGRVKTSLYKKLGSSEQVLMVWIGTYDIAAHKIGRPVQAKAGVRTGKHFWPGAFMMQPVNAPHPMVWKRAADSSHKFQRSRKSGRMMWMGLPLEKQTLPVYSEARQAVIKLQPQLLERLKTLLEQELNYVFNVES